MQTDLTLDRLLWSWPTVCRLATDEWAKGFALSIQRQSRNPRWRPTDRQLSMMRRLVCELYQRDPDDLPLIEEAE